MLNTSLGPKLKELRNKCGLSVPNVVRQLKFKNIIIAEKTLYGYENNVSNLKSSTFLALCEIYGVSDILATFVSQIPPAKEDWEVDIYEDYFNGRSVNEKVYILEQNGRPTFKGQEDKIKDDVLFGRHEKEGVTPIIEGDKSPIDKELASLLTTLTEDQKKILIAQIRVVHEQEHK